MAAFVVAVTGGVASGKSAVTRRFQALGITVADADVEAREIVRAGQPALSDIVRRFGSDALGPDGSLDRGRMRALVFADPEARRDLESITHPRIRVNLRQACESADGPYAVVAIPLLAEASATEAYPWVRRVLVVDAPTEMQRTRLMSRDGISLSLANEILAAQAGRNERLAIATDVVVNDGSLEALDAAVARLDARFRLQS